MNDHTLTCPSCGGGMKEGFELCRKCFLAEAARDGKLCECGGLKKVEYPTCFNCARDKAAGENRLCVCGKLKSANFDKCRICSGLPPKEKK